MPQDLSLLYPCSELIDVTRLGKPYVLLALGVMGVKLKCMSSPAKCQNPGSLRICLVCSALSPVERQETLAGEPYCTDGTVQCLHGAGKHPTSSKARQGDSSVTTSAVHTSHYVSFA